jgi:hypothetical protein
MKLLTLKHHEIMKEHNSLSQLLYERTKSICTNNVTSKYTWNKYFNSNYTFSLRKLKKKNLAENPKDETSSCLRNEGKTIKITPSYVRSELLCSMINLHNSLHEESGGASDGYYKGQSK